MDVALTAAAFAATFTQMMLAMVALGREKGGAGIDLNGWLHILSWLALSWVAALLFFDAIGWHDSIG